MANDGSGGLSGSDGDPQAGREIVGAALAGRRLLQPHEAGHRLIEGTVPAHGHHQVVRPPLGGGSGCRVSGGSGLVDVHQISCLTTRTPRQTAAPGTYCVRPWD